MSGKVGLSFRYLKKLPPYEDALREAGIEPARITPDEPVSLEGLAGLVITGGTDPNPKLYGQQPHPKTDPPDSARDELESRLIREALAADLPVLAICRGMQLFNVVHGGSLLQDAENHRAPHTLIVEPGTRLAGIVGPGEREVNSRHHQAVDVPGKGLVVAARAIDGVVEALERPDKRFAVAVQWHPEDRIREAVMDRKLFEAFADALIR